jgi:hypothetical protein
VSPTVQGCATPNGCEVVVRKSVKLDLPFVLGMVYGWPNVPSSVLLEEMQRTFRCKRRAAQDALHVLIEGGWLERLDYPQDARRKLYRVTEHGAKGLSRWSGWREMRVARWRYSSTSTRARTRRSRDLFGLARYV